ncbi:HAD family hydrolase [Stratiformator vulcanicus]|uniref:Phosphoglycolate phosphatase n=1 Tax=Stratiformator vulcanicus TaxID=2527980 RepID=A0A517QW65_9PLAN|nr:HAD family hydrolase [Stratiformator vulcanicus]QDT35818.1 Phosphoglycolate phosphatase [Stratiformator vulcanicus]
MNQSPIGSTSVDDHPPLRAVVFDAVGTVLHPQPDVVTAYHEIGRQHGSSLSRDEVGRRFREAFTSRAETELETSDAIEYEFWRYVVGKVFRDVVDPEACFRQLHEHFAQPTSWRFDSETERVLTALGLRGVVRCIASNFDARLDGILDASPVGPLFDHRVISSKIGYRKPHRRFYEIVLETCGTTAAETLFIGDEPAADREGPAQLGCRALLLDPGCSGEENCVTQLRDVLCFLEAN